jgi:hypothetical protein
VQDLDRLPVRLLERLRLLERRVDRDHRRRRRLGGGRHRVAGRLVAEAAGDLLRLGVEHLAERLDVRALVAAGADLPPDERGV